MLDSSLHQPQSVLPEARNDGSVVQQLEDQKFPTQPSQKAVSLNFNATLALLMPTLKHNLSTIMFYVQDSSQRLKGMYTMETSLPSYVFLTCCFALDDL